MPRLRGALLGPQVERCADNHAGDQHHERRRHRAEQRLVATGEDLELVNDARRTGDDRLARQITLDVLLQLDGRLVAAVAVLFQGLEDDGFQVGVHRRDAGATGRSGGRDVRAAPCAGAGAERAATQTRR